MCRSILFGFEFERGSLRGYFKVVDSSILSVLELWVTSCHEETFDFYTYSRKRDYSNCEQLQPSNVLEWVTSVILKNVWGEVSLGKMNNQN